jgi:hypothetical protein
MSATLALAEQLIARRSVTPDDGGCQALIADRLAPLGFACTHLPFGPEAARVKNLWAVRRGGARDGKLLVFAGHTDVVPTGPLDRWSNRSCQKAAASSTAVRGRHEEADRRWCRRRGSSRSTDHAGAHSLLITSDEGPGSTAPRASALARRAARSTRRRRADVGLSWRHDQNDGAARSPAPIRGVQVIAYHSWRNPDPTAPLSRARRRRVGPRQRALPADLVADVESMRGPAPAT